MANSYSKTAPGIVEDKKEPSKSVLQFILNYSKGVEVKKSKQESLLIHLN
ncbi:MAG TPA: hypothetical protein VKX29_04760 [Brumimicrobium sp.]|nr:hypothetical protein [Brumimicrobium sp.]